MFTKDKIAQNLLKHFHKMYFELIDSFMSGKPHFNPSHSQDLHESR